MILTGTVAWSTFRNDTGLRVLLLWFLLSFLVSFVLASVIWNEPLFWDPDYKYTVGEYYHTDMSKFFLKVEEFLLGTALLNLLLTTIWIIVRFRRLSRTPTEIDQDNPPKP